MAVDAHGMPIRMLITDGTTADCTQAEHLIKGINPTSLLANKAYDTDTIIQQCQARRIDPVIPSKKNRKVQRAHDVQIYKSRH